MFFLILLAGSIGVFVEFCTIGKRCGTCAIDPPREENEKFPGISGSSANGFAPQPRVLRIARFDFHGQEDPQFSLAIRLEDP